MSRAWITLLVGVLIGALIVAGCGSGDEEATAAPIAKAAFVKRARAICEETYKRVQAGYLSFVEEVDGEPFSELEEIEDYADTVLIPVKQREVAELRALGAPRGDEAKVEAIIAAYEEGIEKAEASARDAVTSSSGVFVKATEVARAYGLVNCRY